MRISVRHATIYRCDPPMRYVTQSHRLTPASSEAQTILAWEVAAEGAVFGAEFVDGAGDLLATMTIQGPLERIEVVASGVVETTDTAGVLRGHRETMPPQVYLGEHRDGAEPGDVRDARGIPLPDSTWRTPWGLRTALSACGREQGTSPTRPARRTQQSTAAEALERGEGVCQDHAHALITVARLGGMPARYVTGYLLRDGDGDGDQGEATHGWAEIHVEGAGLDRLQRRQPPAARTIATSG